GKELTGGHLLEGGGVEDIVDTFHGRKDAVRVTNVADVEPHLGALEGGPHVFLLLLVTAENADFLDIGLQKPPENGMAECSGTAGDEKRALCEHDNALVRCGPTVPEGMSSIFCPAPFPTFVPSRIRARRGRGARTRSTATPSGERPGTAARRRT